MTLPRNRKRVALLLEEDHPSLEPLVSFEIDTQLDHPLLILKICDEIKLFRYDNGPVHLFEL